MPAPSNAGRVVVAAALAVLGGCAESTLEIGRPLDITLLTESPAQAELGTEHRFRVEAQGRALLGVILAFGDGQVDSAAAHGAQTASIRFQYTYPDTGTFLVTARAEDSTGRAASDELSVRVVPVP